LAHGYDRAVGQDVGIRGERPEALVDDVVLAAVRTDLSVVARIGAEPVLQYSRLYAGRLMQILQLLDLVAVADAKLPDLAALGQRFHGPPGFESLCPCRQTRMQHESVQAADSQVTQRYLERLCDLLGNRRLGVIGNALRIVARQRRELCLH